MCPVLKASYDERDRLNEGQLQILTNTTRGALAMVYNDPRGKVNPDLWNDYLNYCIGELEEALVTSGYNNPQQWTDQLRDF